MDKYYQFGFWFLYLLGMYPTYLALVADGGKINTQKKAEVCFFIVALGLWWVTSILMMAVNVNDRR